MGLSSPFHTLPKKVSNFPEAIHLVNSRTRIKTQDYLFPVSLTPALSRKKLWVSWKHTLFLTTEKV